MKTIVYFVRHENLIIITATIWKENFRQKVFRIEVL